MCIGQNLFSKGKIKLKIGLFEYSRSEKCNLSIFVDQKNNNNDNRNLSLR